MSASPFVFDRSRQAKRRSRAFGTYQSVGFLKQRVAEDILDRITLTKRRFTTALEIGAGFLDMKAELDPQRLEQEMVLLAQKSDVAEELDRLSTHVTEVRRVLKAGGQAGRRLDFLMQELNREANTLGSKAFDPRSTQAAVNLKVLIEQMREQVQNIE